MRFLSVKFQVDLSVLYEKKMLHTPKFFTSMSLHNHFSAPGLNTSDIYLGQKDEKETGKRKGNKCG